MLLKVRKPVPAVPGTPETPLFVMLKLYPEASETVFELGLMVTIDPTPVALSQNTVFPLSL